MIRTSTLLILLLFLNTAFARIEQLPQTAELLPAETLMYAGIDNFSQFHTDSKKMDLYQLIQDESMKPFLASLKEKFEEMLDKDESRLADLIFDKKILPEGRIFAAVIGTNEPEENDDAFPLLLIQWGNSAEKVQKALDDDIQRLVREGLQRKDDTYRQVRITTIIKPTKSGNGGEAELLEDENDSNFNPPSAKPETYHNCFVKDVQILSMSRKSLEFVVAHLQGAKGQTLQQNNTSLAALRSLDNSRPLEFFINIKQVLKESDFTFTSPDKSAKTLQALGLDGLEAMMGVFQPAPNPQVSFNSKILLHCPTPRRGILKAFEMKPGRPLLPAFLDSQAGGIGWVNLDISMAAQEIFRSISAISPAAAASLNSPLIPPDSPDSSELFTVLDLIGTLTSPVIISAKVTQPSESLPISNEQLFAIGLREKGKLASAIGKLHEHFIEPKWPNSRREYMGYPMYVIPVPDFDTEPEGDTPPTPQASQNIAWCLTDDFLLAGLEPAVEQALSRISNPSAEKLQQQPWIQSCQKSLPGPVGYAEFINSRKQLRLLWQALQDENSDFHEMMELNKLAKEGFDFSLLPPFEAVEKYLGFGVSFMQMRQEGVYFESRLLKAPK